MKERIARMRDERGIAMVFAVILVALAGLISVSLLALVQTESTHSRKAVVQGSSYQAAEAGIDGYLGKLLQDSAYPTQYMAAGESSRTIGGATVAGSADNDVDIPDTSSWGYSSKDVWVNPSKLDAGYQYNLEICLPAQTCTGFTGTSTYLRILSTGRPTPIAGRPVDKSTWRAVEVQLRPKSISDFQMLSNASITYGDKATTYGDVYVVSDPNCGKRGYPACNTLTHQGTAYGSLYADYQVTGSPTLKNGAKIYDKDSTPYTIRQVIQEPPSFDAFVSSIGDIQSAATSGGLYFDLGSQYGTPPKYEAWQLNFKSDGTVDVSKCKKTKVGNAYQNVWHVAPACDPPVNYPLPANGAIYSPQTILVQGTVAAKVTVCSGGSSSSALGNVVISGNISYQSEGNDVLGMVAKNNVVVANQVPDTLTWRGATLSQTGGFIPDPDGYTAHTAMTFTGSTATATGGSMLMFGTRNYLYDGTLRFLPPPLFPSVGSAYQVVVEREVSP